MAVIEPHQRDHDREADYGRDGLPDDEVVDVVVRGESDREAGAVNEDEADDNEAGRGRQDRVVGLASIKAAGRSGGHGMASSGRASTTRFLSSATLA